MQEVRVPEISENVDSGTVISIHVSEGDQVEKDQDIVELETDKAAVDIPSPAAGTVSEILVSEGDEVSVGDVILKLEEGGESGGQAGRSQDTGTGDDTADTDGDAEKEAKSGGKKRDGAGKSGSADEGGSQESDRDSDGGGDDSGTGLGGDRGGTEGGADKQDADGKQRESSSGDATSEKAAGDETTPASPSVRRFARELGIELSQVDGSGPSGRISADDVKQAVRGRMSGEAKQPATPERQEERRGERREEMTRIRRLTAENTAASWTTAPHVTHFDEIDLQEINAYIEKREQKVAAKGGKLTVTAVMIQLCARALERFPRFNTTVDMESKALVYHEGIHIGVAVDTDRGLLVPVVRDANRKDAPSIAIEIVELAKRAREGDIGPDELSGGTFSVSNLGGIGGTAFTPIIQQPHTAILGMARARVQPVWNGEEFEPRTHLPVALSYDHRANDGADAARFVRWLHAAAEDPLTAMLEGGR